MRFIKIFLVGAVLSMGLIGVSFANDTGTVESPQVLGSGIIFKNMEQSVSPKDDFYSYINGAWVKNTQIPQDKSSWGSFQKLGEDTSERLAGIIKSLESQQNFAKNSDGEKIVYFYDSYINESALNQLGNKPILPMLRMIDNLDSKQEIPWLIGALGKYGVDAPFAIAIHQDAKNSNIVVADIVQSGLGLPDRDYYIESKDPTLMGMKAQYESYVASMLKLNHDVDSTAEANKIVGLETKLAKLQWTNVENRDPVKTYNKVLIKKLSSIMPNFDWSAFLSEAKIAGKTNSLIISQPSYLTNLNKLIQSESLETWKLYFKWKVINAYAGYLSKDYNDRSFNFYGTVLSGTPKQKLRNRRGVDLVNGSLGFALGRLYVERYFPESSKKQMQELVGNLIKEYSISIESLDWMGAKTKQQAQDKLAKMSLKIGYPDTWRDYSLLVIKKDDLVGNIIRTSEFEYNRNINKLGRPVDKTEWMMTPQTVNAYYNPEFNEIVFPAAILQAPFFDPRVDNAANYGGIGAVIGHEISHAFDDQGSQYDANGNLRNWWTKKDRENFEKKTAQLVKQYSGYSPIKGYYVNGKLTLGENIADNSGLAIAYKAYHLSLNHKDAKVIDGLTGDERFYSNWAQVWCNKIREKQALMYLKTDPHSPAKFRANGALSNQDGFYTTYSIKPRDKMYIAPLDRVHIW